MSSPRLFDQISPEEIAWMQKIVNMVNQLKLATGDDLERMYEDYLNYASLEDLMDVYMEFEKELRINQKQMINLPLLMKKNNFSQASSENLMNVLKHELVKCIEITPRLKEIVEKRTANKEAFDSYPANRL